MRVLLLNPNTSCEMTRLMGGIAAAKASPGTEIVLETATRGVSYISGPAEALIGGSVALEILAERQDEIDVAIIAAFGDPGLMAARDLVDVPVVGMAEAAMIAASIIGRGFSLVAFNHDLASWYRDCVEMHGMTRCCLGIHAPATSIGDTRQIDPSAEEALVQLAEAAVQGDGSGAIIFAGAPLSGLAERVGPRVSVPVVDQVASAVRLAEMVGFLAGGAAARTGALALRSKPTTGLPPALAGLLEGRRNSVDASMQSR